MKRVPHAAAAAFLCALLVTGCEAASEQATVEETRAAEEVPVTTTSDDARTAYDDGMRLLDVGRNVEANAAFRRAIEADPSFVRAWLGLSASASSSQEFRESIREAATRTEGASEGEVLLVQISETFLTDDSPRRLDLARQLVEAYPSSARARLELAFAHQALGDNEAARQVMTEAIGLAPDLVAPHIALGFSYLFQEPRDFAQAKAHMDHWIEMEPDEAKAYEGLGDAMRGLNDLEAASEAYTTALEKDPSLAIASHKKGHVESFLGNWEAARAAYDEANRIQTDAATRLSTSNYRAFVSLHADDPAAAIEELDGVLASIDGAGLSESEANGIRMFTLNNQAVVAFHADMPGTLSSVTEKAHRVMDAQKAASPEDAELAREIDANKALWDGWLAARTGDWQAAQAAADRHAAILEPVPNPRKLESYHALLGVMEEMRGNHAAAIGHLRQADPADVYAKYVLAYALEASGQAEEAKTLFADVATTNFNSPDYAMIRRDAMSRM